MSERLLSLAEQVVERATRAGAHVAEAVASQGAELSVKVRLGEPVTGITASDVHDKAQVRHHQLARRF